MSRKYNFNSIGDLLDYKRFLESEIKKYEKYVYFIPFPFYSFYVKYYYYMLNLINILIKKKGYNV